MHVSKTRLENMSVRARWAYLTKGCDPEKLKKFKDFHSTNPYVYDSLEGEAERQMSEGWRKSSVWLVLNIIRWGPGSTVDSESSFKISNDYFAFYSRLLISRHPKFVNWIEIKSLKGQTFDYASDSFGGVA